MPFTGRQKSDADKMILQYYLDTITQSRLQEYPTALRLLGFFHKINPARMCLYHEMTSGCGINTLKMRHKLWALQKEEATDEQVKLQKTGSSPRHADLSSEACAHELTKKANEGCINDVAEILADMSKTRRKKVLRFMDPSDREGALAAMSVPDKMQEYLQQADPNVVSHLKTVDANDRNSQSSFVLMHIVSLVRPYCRLRGTRRCH